MKWEGTCLHFFNAQLNTEPVKDLGLMAMRFTLLHGCHRNSACSAPKKHAFATAKALIVT